MSAGGRKAEKRALMRGYLRKRDGDNCWLCGRLIEFSAPPKHPMSVTFEHVVPRNLGGTENWFNLRLTHKLCNERRGPLADRAIISGAMRYPYHQWEDDGGLVY